MLALGVIYLDQPLMLKMFATNIWMSSKSYLLWASQHVGKGWVWVKALFDGHALDLQFFL
jgi:hypothetical protein